VDDYLKVIFKESAFDKEMIPGLLFGAGLLKYIKISFYMTQ